MKETVNFRDLKIKVGDTLEVTIKCHTGDVKYTGVVIFEEAAFKLKHTHLNKEHKVPLCGFSYNCDFKKLN